MRGEQNDCTEITVSVVGLSGPSSLKGLNGIGKSFLCQRLTQPDRLSKKHSSVISQMDFYGPVINQSHFLYWGQISKVLNDKSFKINVIEQTAFIDDTTYQEFSSNELYSYVDRCTNCVLTTKKKVYRGEINGDSSESFCDDGASKVVDVFLLLYDVSFVDKRNCEHQDAMFKRIFDLLIRHKRQLIVVTTKNDECDVAVQSRLHHILEKAPYSRYVQVHTSALRDVNVNAIVDLILAGVTLGFKTVRQRHCSYEVGLQRSEEERTALQQVLQQSLGKWMMQQEGRDSISWSKVVQCEQLHGLVTRYGRAASEAEFEKLQLELRTKRKRNRLQHWKSKLRNLLVQYEHLLPEQTGMPITEVVATLKVDESWRRHFIDWASDDLCSFPDDDNKLPSQLLTPGHQDNCLQVVDSVLRQRVIERSFVGQLMPRWQDHLSKTEAQVGEWLQHKGSHSLNEPLLHKVYEQFQIACVPLLRCRFLEHMHSCPDVFWSHIVLRCTEINPETPATDDKQRQQQLSTLRIPFSGEVDQPSPRQDSNRYQQQQQQQRGSLARADSFVDCLVADLNHRIEFPVLPISRDRERLREAGIQRYLSFLLSASVQECLYRDEGQGPCCGPLLADCVSRWPSACPSDRAYSPVPASHQVLLLVLGSGTATAAAAADGLAADLNSLCSLDYADKTCPVHNCAYRFRVCQSRSEWEEMVSVGSYGNCGCSGYCGNTSGVATPNGETGLCKCCCQATVLIKVTDCWDAAADGGDSDMDWPHLINLSFTVTIANDLEPEITREFEREEEILPWSPSTAGQLLHQTMMSVIPCIVWVVGFCGHMPVSTSASLTTHAASAAVSCSIETGADLVLNTLSHISSLHRLAGSASCVAASLPLQPLPGQKTYPHSQRQLRVNFLSYHEAIKLLLQTASPAPIDALILLTNSGRPASFKTLLSLRRSLQTRHCRQQHCFLILSNDKDDDRDCDITYDEKFCNRAGLTIDHVDRIRLSHKTTLNSESPTLEKPLPSAKLTSFIHKIIQQSTRPSSPTSSTMYLDDVSLSLSVSTDVSSVSTKCRLCCESCHRMTLSGSSLTSKSIFSNLASIAFNKRPSNPLSNKSEHSHSTTILQHYAKVPGNRNQERYKFHNQLEHFFHTPQNAPNKCVRVKCNIHQRPDSETVPTIRKTFRTRIRSQSGPDLRSETTRARLSVVGGSVTPEGPICDSCGRCVLQPCLHFYVADSTTDPGGLKGSTTPHHDETDDRTGGGGDGSSCNAASSSGHQRSFRISKTPTPGVSKDLGSKKIGSKLQDFFYTYLRPPGDQTHGSNCSSVGGSSHTTPETKQAFSRSFARSKHK